MKVFGIISLILMILILIVYIILFKYYYTERLKKLNFKINKSYSEYKDRFIDKYNFVSDLSKGIQGKYKIKNKIFTEFKKINIEEINIKNEKIIDQCFEECKDIKKDREKKKEDKQFKKLIKNYNENELSLISLRTYHNKYTNKYNKLIKKYPYSLISKFKKYGPKIVLEGKELELD